MINYLLVSISYIRIRRKEPHLARPFEVRKWKVVGIGAIASALFFLYLFMPFSGRSTVWTKEWYLILGWTCIGALLAVITTITYPRTTASEREMLLFGEEYSREDIVNS